MPTKTTKTKKVAATKKKAATKTTAAAKKIKDERESNRLRQQRFLERHRDEINEKRRERYAERKESGRCPRCGVKRKSSKRTLCKDCLEMARYYNQN
jgi:flagellar biosynthesis/type III secretory pathway protein FliH